MNKMALFCKKALNKSLDLIFRTFIMFYKVIGEQNE